MVFERKGYIVTYNVIVKSIFIRQGEILNHFFFEMKTNKVHIYDDDSLNETDIISTYCS